MVCIVRRAAEFSGLTWACLPFASCPLAVPNPRGRDRRMEFIRETSRHHRTRRAPANVNRVWCSQRLYAGRAKRNGRRTDLARCRSAGMLTPRRCAPWGFERPCSRLFKRLNFAFLVAVDRRTLLSPATTSSVPTRQEIFLRRLVEAPAGLPANSRPTPHNRQWGRCILAFPRKSIADPIFDGSRRFESRVFLHGLAASSSVSGNL